MNIVNRRVVQAAFNPADTNLTPIPTLEPPLWLLTDFNNSVWTVTTGDKKGGAMSIDFRVMLPDGSLLTDSDNQVFLDTIKAALYLERCGNAWRHTSKGGGMRRTFDSIIVLLKWMTLNRVPSFSRLGLDEIDLYEEDLVAGQDRTLKLEERLDDVLLALGDAEISIKSDGYLDRGLIAEMMHESPGTLSSSSSCVAKIDDFCRLKNLKVPARRSDNSKAAKISKAQLSFRLQALQSIWVVGRFYPHLDSIAEDVDVSAHTARAHNKGRQSEQTGVIATDDALVLLNTAIRWIMDYADPLLDLRDKAERHWGELKDRDKKWRLELMRRFLEGLDQPKFEHRSPFPVQRFLLPKCRDSLAPNEVPLAEAVYKMLPAACYVITAAFTARREVELTGLTADCLQKNERGEKVIDFYVAKTERDNRTFPVVEILERAISVMARISEPLRADGVRNELFLVRSLRDLSVRSFTSAMPLVSFAEYAGIADRKWHFSDHQFRRFFAVVYFWRGKGANLDALSMHMAHFDYEMTIHYLKNILKVPEISKLRDEKLYEVLDGVLQSGQASGGFGNTLKRLRRLILSKIKVVSPAKAAMELSKAARRVVDNSDLDLVLQPWGFCTGNSPSRASKAACAKDGIPAPLEASYSDCGRCQNYLVSDEFVPELEARLRNAKELSDQKSLVPTVRAQADAQVRFFQKMLRSLEFGLEGVK